ncbi:hypothetical protein [Aneurinibacillus sp. REN35]|uniref:hypothetical protein n=1 Tax=Aneurinibacillus sp. REN35 TaxID=3237286 RepID=UPI0035279BC1
MHTTIEGKSLIFFVGANKIESVIFGIENPYEKKVQSMRRLLGGIYGVPVLTLPLREAEVAYNFYNEYKVGTYFPERILRQYCLKRKAKYIVVRRALGLHSAIGQNKQMPCEQEWIDWMEETVFPTLASRFNNCRNQPFTFAIWSDPQSRAAAYVVEKLRSFPHRIHAFPLCPASLCSSSEGTIQYHDRWQALENASVLFMLEQASTFLTLPLKDWKMRQATMKHRVIVDPYGLYEPEEMEAIDCDYMGYGYFP